MGLKDFFKMSSDQWGLPSEHLEGVPGCLYKQNIALITQQDRQLISIQIGIEGKEIALLPFNQLVQVNHIVWEKTFTHKRDPVSEAFWGGVIGGPAVGVASAMAAQGNPRLEHVKYKKALEIRYHPGNNPSAINYIVVNPVLLTSMVEQWALTLARCAGLPEPRHIQPIKMDAGPTYL